VSAFIDERRADFGVERVCRTLGVSASAHYERKSGKQSQRAIEDERLTALIRQVSSWPRRRGCRSLRFLRRMLQADHVSGLP
jgi:hypothetical protein